MSSRRRPSNDEEDTESEYSNSSESSRSSESSENSENSESAPRGRAPVQRSNGQRCSQQVQAHRPYVSRKPNQCSFDPRDRNYDESLQNNSSSLLNQNSGSPNVQSLSARPYNCRTYDRLKSVKASQTNCNIGSGFSQFQVYCSDDVPLAQDQLDRMQWPLLTRFFDNKKVPGYAIHIKQHNSGVGGNGRYVGEAYWIGWSIPFWMNLPPALLNDDDKCKLTLYWIVRQRRFHDLHQYRKLSMLICTYYPTNQQFMARENTIKAKYQKEVQDYRDYQNDPDKFIQDHKHSYAAIYGREHPPSSQNAQLWAIQPSVNTCISDNPPTYAEIQEENLEYDPFMYVLNGGKGADLARNKNMGLSVILQSRTIDPATGRQRLGISSHPWIVAPFQVQQQEYHWDDMYDRNINVPELLDGFLNQYEQSVFEIFSEYRNRVRSLLEYAQPAASPSINRDGVAQFFYNRSYDHLDSKDQKDQLDKWLQFQHGVIVEELQNSQVRTSPAEVLENLAVRETSILMRSILRDHVKETLYRYNSNPKPITFPIHST